MIYVGKKAEELFRANIENRVDRISGYFKDADYWIAYDNNSREMFVEEFKDEKYAIAWVNGIDVIFDEQIKVRQIFSRFYYIPKYFFLKITIKDEIMTSKIIRFFCLSKMAKILCLKCVSCFS